MTCLRNDGKQPVVIGGLVVPSGAVIEIDEGQAVFVREKLPLLTEVTRDSLPLGETMLFVEGYVGDVGSELN